MYILHARSSFPFSFPGFVKAIFILAFLFNVLTNFPFLFPGHGSSD